MQRTTALLLFVLFVSITVADTTTTTTTEKTSPSVLTRLRNLAENAKDTIANPIRHMGQAFTEVFEVVHPSGTLPGEVTDRELKYKEHVSPTTVERDATTHETVKKDISGKERTVGQAASDTLAGAKETVSRAKDATLEKAAGTILQNNVKF